MLTKHLVLLTTLLSALLVTQHTFALSQDELEKRLETIVLPPGFEISLYAHGVQNARQMALGDNGTLFVGSMGAGKVYAVVDSDKDFKADNVITLLSASKPLPDGAKLVRPSGLAYYRGDLYIGAISHVLKFENIESKLERPGDPIIVTSDYPDKIHHGWKFIAFGPDKKLYVSVGAWCNVCDNEDELFASITRINPDGTGREVIAKGVRNTVGFDWHPQTHELWFTENGRDSMGDDMPADELNRLSRVGQHFGFPYIHQGDTPDPQFGKGRSVADFTKPAMKLGPHVAALGMRFYTGSMFPPAYKNQIFIAEHGSWNRPIGKVGYRITLVQVENNEATRYEEFARGWLDGQRAWGRPADVLVMPDGSLLVSDDQAHAIYRITYKL